MLAHFSQTLLSQEWADKVFLWSGALMLVYE